MLLTPLLVLLASAVLVPFLTPRWGRATGYAIAAAFVLSYALLLRAAPEVMAGGTVVQTFNWVPTFDVSISLRLNGLSLLFGTLVLCVGALIMSYVPQYVDPDYDHGRLYGILTLFGGSMLGLVLAGDLILLLVFWEITTLCSFLLIGGRGLEGSRPATRALIVTAGGGFALLAAVVLLIARVGTSDLTEVIARAPQELGGLDLAAIGVLVIVAAFTKSAQVPFHFWLPGAMVAITPVSAYLHAATLVKAGIYLLLLFSPLFTNVPGWHITLMSVGSVTAVFGAFQALRQNDMKALLAYSTVSQLGLMVALVGVGTSAALAAAALLVAAHALFKATLFMLVGIIDRQAGSRDLRKLSGLRRAMPITAALTALAAASMAGLPPLVGFVAKEEAFYAFLGTSDAEWTAGTGWTGFAAAAIAVVAASLTFAYSARIIIGAFGGPLVQPSLREPPLAFLAPAALPAVLGLVLGLAPFLLNDIVNRAVQDTGFTETPAQLALLHGLGAALALSATAITLGVLIHRQRHRLTRILGEEPPVPLGPALFDRWWDATLAFGARVGRPAQVTTAGVHLAGITVAVALLGAGVIAAVLGGAAVLPPASGGTTQPYDWVILLVLIPAVLALARITEVVGALVLAGFIGLLLTVWLVLLGAPDVALTLMLVEILTVVVASQVLGRLPRRPRARQAAGRRVRLQAAAAVGTGLLAGGLVWVFTGRREASPLSAYYLAEAEAATGGSNVVNTILVDFRGLDTLGEIVVLAAAAFGLLAAAAALPAARRGTEVFGPGELAVLRVGSVVVVPLLVGGGAVLFWRGHDEPGGGFIAGLVLGAALAVARIAGLRIRLPAVRLLLAVGLLLAIGTGVFGLAVAGAFGEPVKLALPGGASLTTSLIFDLGVLLVVVGLVRAALSTLDDKPMTADRRAGVVS